jgi:hypothetical protein
VIEQGTLDPQRDAGMDVADALEPSAVFAGAARTSDSPTGLKQPSVES